MGIVQDTLLGSQKLTQRGVFIDRAMLMNMVMWMKQWDGRIPAPAVMLPRKGCPGAVA
jgi:DNA-directed RNA polymerase II subunit RPB1